MLEVLKKPTATCEILGRIEPRSVGLLDPTDPHKGIYVTYGNGDKCNVPGALVPGASPKLRETKFSLYCAEQQSEFEVDFPGKTQGQTKCEMKFKAYSPAGCPGGTFGASKSTTILIWLCTIFVLYLVLGYILNVKQKDIRGVEAVPHIDFWRDFPSLVQDGLSISLVYSKKAYEMIRRKIQGQNSGYSDI